MPKSDSKTYTSYEKTETPPGPVEPLPIFWALAIVDTTRKGIVEKSIIALECQGKVILRAVPLPEGNHEKLETALGDFAQASKLIYRHRQIKELLAGRV